MMHWVKYKKWTDHSDKYAYIQILTGQSFNMIL